MLLEYKKNTTNIIEYCTSFMEQNIQVTHVFEETINYDLFDFYGMLTCLRLFHA